MDVTEKNKQQKPTQNKEGTCGTGLKGTVTLHGKK